VGRWSLERVAHPDRSARAAAAAGTNRARRRRRIVGNYNPRGVSLSERLRNRIAREGPISFYDFMRAALYDPEEGYYSRGGAIGDGGDFVTSPSVSPAFARSLARLFLLEIGSFEGEIDFVEVGAGSGRFLEDFAAAVAA